MPTDVIWRSFDAYLADESPRRIRQLQNDVISDPTFSRATPWHEHATRLLSLDRWDEAIRVIQRFMPGAWLSPDAHSMLSYSYAQILDEEASRLEAFYANTAFEIIAGSGTGNEQKPWRVLQVPDQYAFLRRRGLTTQQQHAVTTEAGALLDAHTGADGTTVWFELVNAA